MCFHQGSPAGAGDLHSQEGLSLMGSPMSKGWKRLAKRGLTVVGFLLLQVEADHDDKNAAVSLALKTAEK